MCSRTTITLGHRTLSYALHGDPSLTHPVIYFHGFPGSSAEASLCAEVAARHKLSLIAFDRAGTGGSSPVNDHTPASTARDTCALLDHLKLKQCVFLALSGGGPFLLAALSAAGARVRAAHLVSAMGSPECRGAMEHVVMRNRVLLRAIRSAPACARLFIALMRLQFRISPDLPIIWMSRGMSDDDQRILATPRVRSVLHENLQATLGAPRCSLAAELVSMATLPAGISIETDAHVTIWHGTEDRYVSPQMAQWYRGIFPQATLRLVVGRGHFMMVDLADEILREIAREFDQGFLHAPVDPI